MACRLARLAVLSLLLVAAGCGPEPAEAPADAPAGAPAAVVAPEPGADAEPSRTGGQETVAAMQGTWQSLDDPLSVLRIEGDAVASVYDGETLSTETIRAVRSCDDLTEDPMGTHFTLSDGETEPLCYEMDAVDGSSLAYIYLPRGNRLAYERVEG
ncbi:hypothetical protein [Rubrivirga sp. IMCC45206]|uniref:hypothetical protein n=1 Tax=Rubrivirga sp. IMCC45206 TaxID=3391614 RepID=UPI0039900260